MKFFAILEPSETVESYSRLLRRAYALIALLVHQVNELPFKVVLL
jgi:hypothetical protein